MDGRLKLSLVMGVLLASGGAVHFLSRHAPAQPDVLQVAATRGDLEQCLHSARITFDVHWAIACAAEADQGAPGADGNAECDLPDDRAAGVNAWLDRSEARCRAEALTGH